MSGIPLRLPTTCPKCGKPITTVDPNGITWLCCHCNWHGDITQHARDVECQMATEKSWSDYMAEHGREEYDAWERAVKPLVDAARLETARRCAEIAERHRQEWIRPSEGAAPVVVGSHACQLVIDEIRREFNLPIGGN